MMQPIMRQAVTDMLLRKLERFAPLSAGLRSALAALPFRLQDFDRGQSITSQGDSPEETTFVVEGIIFRVKLLQDGSRQILSLQLPGDFSDLHGFILKPVDHALCAGAPTRIARVPHAALQSLTEQFPQLTRALMRDMALDAAISREWLATLGRRSAYCQLAHLFCELYFRIHEVGKVRDDCFDLPLTQTDLGDACGLSTVHVNRSLQALRKDKLIILENHVLCVPDIAALMETASFDPAYLYLPKLTAFAKP